MASPSDCCDATSAAGPGFGLATLSHVLGKAEAWQPLRVTVRETLGIARRDWPVEIPLSLPKGLLKEDQTLVLRQADQLFPTQVQWFTRWDDGSGQHVMLHASVDVPANAELDLELGQAVVSERQSMACAVDVTAITVDTGAAKFVIDAGGARQIVSASVDQAEFLAPDGEVACWAGFIADATLAGSMAGPHRLVSQEDSYTRLIEAGPVRCVVAKRVRFLATGGSGAMDLYTWFYFYRNQPWVRLYSWLERGDYLSHPMVSREIAFAADLAYRGPALQERQSRFDPVSCEEIYTVQTPTGRATVVLPWLRELGMKAPTNFVVQSDSSKQAVRIEWRPVDSHDLEQSPMNGICWVPRYWREAALLVGERSAGLEQAVRRRLELRDLEVQLDPGYQPHQALLDRLTVMGEQEEELLQLAEACDSYYLSENYPEDGIDGGETQNWYSAYFHGFAWRAISLNERAASYPRTMKPDVGEVMLTAYALTGQRRFWRRAALQARAWPVNVAPSAQEVLGFTFDDMGLHRKCYRDSTPSAVANLVPGTSNVAYGGKLPLALFRMWITTGEPRLAFVQEMLYRRVMATPLSKWPWRPFDGDRNWVVLRDLVRLYQFTEDPKYLADLEYIFKDVPEEMSFERWYGNFHCRFWNNESLALVYRLTGSPKARGLHESLVTDYIKEAKEKAASPRMLMPMTRSLPRELEASGLAYQVGNAAAQWALWDRSGEAQKVLEHFLNVGSQELLAPSPCWPGLHMRNHPKAVFSTSVWLKQPLGPDVQRTDGAASGQVPGDYVRAVTLRARAMVPWIHDAGQRRTTLWIDRYILEKASFSGPVKVRWPGGTLTVETENGQRQVHCQLKHGRVCVSVYGPDQWSTHRAEEAGLYCWLA